MVTLIRLVVSWGINVLALIVVDALFGSVEIGRWGPLVVGGIVLGVANAVLRPLIAVLTLPLVVLSLGIGYFAISVLMLAIAEWVSTDFSIDGFWTYVGATIVISVVNVVLGTILGVRGKHRVRFERGSHR